MVSVFRRTPRYSAEIVSFSFQPVSFLPFDIVDCWRPIRKLGCLLSRSLSSGKHPKKEREREEERSNRLSVCQAKTGAAKDSCQPLNYLGNSIERLGNWNRAKKFRDCEITWLLEPSTWRLILFVSLLSITVHVSRKKKGELVVPFEIIQFQFSRSFQCTVVLFENFSAFHPERHLGGIPPIVP